LHIKGDQPQVINARNDTVSKFNDNTFKICPFEIGIQFNNDSSTLIPAFVKLPFKSKKVIGSPTSNTARSTNVIIKKFEMSKATTIISFGVHYSNPKSEGTEYYCTLDNKGILTIYHRELNRNSGYSFQTVYLKSWL
jgi:hypothetical protein